MTSTEKLLILGVIIMIILPFTGFSLFINTATISNQVEHIQVLKDEICRLNEIIEELQEKKRVCWIPPTV